MILNLIKVLKLQFHQLNFLFRYYIFICEINHEFKLDSLLSNEIHHFLIKLNKNLILNPTISNFTL
jgi:hypothetical protein